MTTALAASTVLALAGSSHGFIVNQFAVQPNGNISPSSGAFVNYYNGYFLGNGSLVTGARGDWKNYGNSILSTTWLGADPRGGGTDADAYANSFSLELAGPGANPFVPLVNAGGGNWLGGATDGLQNDGSAILGGLSGVSWGAGSGDNFELASEVSLVNGISVDSVFFGYFVMSDPGAVLTGTDLLVTIDGVNNFLPLDGTKGSGGYAIGYEEHITPQGDKVIKGFVLVPTPGAAGLLGLAGLAAIRRRR